MFRQGFYPVYRNPNSPFFSETANNFGSILNSHEQFIKIKIKSVQMYYLFGHDTNTNIKSTS